MKRKIKFISILTTLFALYIFILAYSYVNAVSENLSNNVFRLHVIANSDSIEDQNLKYKVRDSLLNYMNTLCNNTSSKENTIQIANSHLKDFKKIAEETIKNEGYSYNVTVEIGNFEFPTKTYGDISFPAGYYDSLRIKIGESKGQNWWCVMFPPLCFVNPTTGIVPEDSKNQLKESLDTEEYKLISEKDTNISIKFKIIELFQKTGFITAKNN